MLDPRPLRIAAISPDHEEPALRLVLSGFEESQFQQQVGALRTLVERQPAAGYRVWGAYREEELRGAALALTQPGRTAVVWPPRLAEGEPTTTSVELLRACTSLLAKRGVRMAQALLPPAAGTDPESLVAAGFRHVSDLTYLVCLADGFPTSPPCRQLHFKPYCSERHDRFAQVVDATYEDTLDCPAVSGVRDIDDVLEGYKGTGQFDPNRWFTVCHRGEEIGCLILTDYPEHATWELIYLGVAPAARGQGWGLEIVRHAQWLARQAARVRLILAVDAANDPALRMYAAAGFQTWDQAAVYLRVFDEDAEFRRRADGLRTPPRFRDRASRRCRVSSHPAPRCGWPLNSFSTTAAVREEPAGTPATLRYDRDFRGIQRRASEKFRDGLD